MDWMVAFDIFISYSYHTAYPDSFSILIFFLLAVQAADQAVLETPLEDTHPRSRVILRNNRPAILVYMTTQLVAHPNITRALDL